MPIRPKEMRSSWLWMILYAIVITSSLISIFINITLAPRILQMGRSRHAIIKYAENLDRVKLMNAEVKTETKNSQKRQSDFASSVNNLNVVESEEEFMRRMEKRMEERRAHVRKVCKERGYEDTVGKIRVDSFYFHKFKVFFCHVPKTGTKNWNKLLLKADSIYRAKQNENLNEDEFYVYMDKTYTNFSIPEVVKRKDTIKLMVVREPMERVVSAFRNRLGKEPRDYMKSLSKNMHEYYGNDNETRYANFNEFVQHLVTSSALIYGDGHWRLYRHICQPCAVDYDVIGTLETANEDSRYLLKLIGAPADYALGGPEAYPSNKDVIKSYYDTVEPRANVMRLFKKLNTDYALYNYPMPDFLHNYIGE